MSIIHVQQIKAQLVNLFNGLVDLSDYTNRSEADKESVFLTRSLAAFSLTHLADINPDVAAACITDGGQDNGIDAIYYDETEKALYFVQTKWKHDGKGTIERGDAQKFITGVKDIINARFERFNQKIQRRSSEIKEALFSAQTRLILVVAYTGQDSLSGEVQRDFDDLLEEMNDPTDVIQLRVLRQGSLHAIIASGTLGAPINLEVVLRNWGQVREPYFAYYGQVSAGEIASWWESHHPRLFAPNLRVFLGLTDVNQGIVETIANNPDHFWYFNNGITALCGSVKKKPIGGNAHDSGVFECLDVKIVNGAQTVGAIASAAAKYPDKASKANVMVRFISLEQCPEGFSGDVTRATNTQNRIERRDFVSLDPQQERLRTELQLDNIFYAYKSGEAIRSSSNGFDLTEATVALACSNRDLAHATQAKREIGKLWEDISRSPYKTLFNPTVSGLRLWRLVQVLRVIDSTLKDEFDLREGKEQMFTVHGNRFLAHQVFKRLPIEKIDDLALDMQYILDQAIILTRKSVSSLITATTELFPEAYLASLFKNLNRCRKLNSHIELI